MEARRKPYVFVTLQGPDDGGDFGPNTPGTKTSGIQEALDYAHAHCRDVYIWGGRGGMHDGEGMPYNIYTLDETLRVPWSQDFRVDGGNALFAYQKTTGHAIHIDSQMNCRYKFGLITSQSPDAAVAIKPETPGPDDFVVVTASLFDFSAVVSSHPDGVGILIDSSKGPIINSLIFAEETNTVGTGVYVTDNGGVGQWISNNRIHVPYGNQYHATGRCTGLRLGDPGSQKIVHNRFEMSFHAPRGAHFDSERKRYVIIEDFVPDDAIGADIFAQRNVLTFSLFGKRAPGQDIVFEPDSRDNTVFAFDLPNGITNKARMPTNKVVPNWTVGFDVPTPPMPASGDEVVNTNPYTMQVIILTPGAVSEWTIADAEGTAQTIPHNLSLVDNLTRPPRPIPPPRPSSAQTISAGLVAGQTFILEPGDRVSFTYTQAPTWRWKALR
ncbi:MAG: hypothetical protein HY710_02665 [Candidatus Latescibacteria bacterium]|nr:hypothetical protein [Candidatus Latescibacterota bacterium]